ncbi:hypothetical protein [Halorubrum sp. DTA98]|uniref:hypothetical protein n=1 Tax=Halorubrum sp. DTA98 TaxID=3402163 RepID=UPI003AAE13B8
MNRHEILDVATVSASALFARNNGFFSRSLESSPIDEAVRNTECTVGDLQPDTVEEITATGPAGEFQAGYLVHHWEGSDVPTLLYHHGSGENPFNFGRISSNSFRRIFSSKSGFDANLIALRAPFHDRSNREYIRAMGELENFVGMLATSTALIQALTERLRDEGCPVILASGISHGGWAVNLHRAYYGGLNRYVPIFAGARLDDLFVSSIYRKLASDSVQKNQDKVAATLDFESDFTAVEGDGCDPLLARYDRIVEFESQRPCYAGLGLDVLEKGHVTGSLATDALRNHVQQSLLAV